MPQVVIQYANIMLDEGVIIPSTNPRSLLVVLAKKKASVNWVFVEIQYLKDIFMDLDYIIAIQVLTPL
jgi:hypothetical protein